MAQDHVDFIADQWQQERPDLDIWPMQAVGRLSRLANYTRQEISELHKQLGLASGEFDVLATLLRSGPPYRLTPTVLFKSAMLTSGAMTNRLNRLEQRGLIERLPDPDDRRSLLVQLSDSGRELINRAVEHHLQLQARLLNALQPEQQRQLNDLLRQLLLSFEHAQE
jgi:DNA-binding MarR family transcriptional regulator